MKDWSGNSRSAHSVLGDSNISKSPRALDDFYATEPLATELLLDLETFSNPVLEPACGKGHMSEVLKTKYQVTSSDVRPYGYGSVQDFFKLDKWNGDIITNPPYKFAKEFVQHAIDIIPEGNKVAMFLKIQFLETVSRYDLLKKHPPRTVYVSVRRLGCAKNGEFSPKDAKAVCYCWFVWEKGFTGNPEIKWFNY